MIENIALIKEVHELMPTKTAQAEAKILLEGLDAEDICMKRLNQCTPMEVLCTMIARAFCTKPSTVIISSPFTIVDNIRDINNFFAKIQSINPDKKILVLDTFANESHYEGDLCHIIK